MGLREPSSRASLPPMRSPASSAALVPPVAAAAQGRRTPPSQKQQATWAAWGAKWGPILSEIGRKVRDE